MQSFVHKVSKHRLWPRRLHGSSLRKKDSINNTSVSLDHEDDIEFQKQLDKIALWFEKWSHLQVHSMCLTFLTYLMGVERVFIIF